MTDARVNMWIVRVIGWVLSYLVLAGAIGLELDWGRRIRPPLPVPKLTPAARMDYPVQSEFYLRSLEQGFAETAARPVFAPDRRPPPPPAPPAPPAPPKPVMQKGQFVLLGALITKDNSIAILREVATGKSMRVEQGKEIKGITVTKVFPEKVILMQYDDSEELVLKMQSLPKSPAVTQGMLAPQMPAGAGADAPASAVGNERERSIINSRRAARGMPPT